MKSRAADLPDSRLALWYAKCTQEVLSLLFERHSRSGNKVYKPQGILIGEKQLFLFQVETTM